MKNEKERYLYVDMPSCNVSNNPNPKDLDPEDPNERGTIYYYLAPSPKFENVENFGNVVSSDWTPCEGTQPEFPFLNSGDPPDTPMDSKKK